MTVLGTLRLFECIICRYWQDGGAFTPAELANPNKDARRCRTCQGFESPRARQVLLPIADNLKNIGPDGLRGAQLHETLSNLLLIETFRGTPSAFEGGSAQDKLATSFASLPSNHALVMATPQSYVVVFVPLDGTCAGQAFKIVMTPCGEQSWMMALDAAPAREWKYEGHDPVEACIDAEKRLNVDKEARGLPGGLAVAYADLPIVDETLGGLSDVLASPEAMVARFLEAGL